MITDKMKNRVARILFAPTGFPTWALSEVFSQLPKDSIMLRHIEDPNSGCYGWIICSEAFSPSNPGDKIPDIAVRVDGIERKVTVTFPEKSEGFFDELGKI